MSRHRPALPIALFAALALLTGCASGGVTLHPVENASRPRPDLKPPREGWVPPRPRLRVPPQYPVDLRRAGIQGEAVVEFTVTAEGDVTDIIVLRANDARFAAAAVAAVGRWKYQPALSNGQAVPNRMQVPIQFSLNQR